MEVLTIATQKGGVGKTSVCWSLGCGLVKRGFTVLLIDSDPQCNLSLTAGVDLLETNRTLYDVFRGKAGMEDAVVPVMPGLSIVPGSIDLASADREFTGAKSFYILRDVLRTLQDDYDYAVIDTPPTLGILTQNALTASDRVIVPCHADVYALQGASQLGAFIDEIRTYTNPKLTVSGILMNQVNDRTNLAKTILGNIDSVAETLHTTVFKSRIRASVNVSEVAMMQKSLFDVYPNGAVTKDFDDFINELMG